MKIARWSLHFYELPYLHKVVWANAVEQSGVFALLRIESDTGHVGLAEGTVKATWSGVSPRSLSATFHDLLMPAVDGLDLSSPGTLTQALQQIPENRMAKGMLETACWTLRACHAGMPLWQHLHGRAEVQLAWTITRQAPALMAREAAQITERYGIRDFKVKGGQGFDIDRQVLRAIRATGDDLTLNVDANSAYSREQAAAYLALLADESADMAEDPCPLQPDSHFEALQQGSALPIVVDRACTTSSDAILFLERGARALSTKPGRIGISEVQAINTLARRHGARVAIGIYAESAFGSLVNLQQAAAVPAALCAFAAEQTFFLTLTDQIVFDLPSIKDGKITLPQTASLDTLLDWQRIEQLHQEFG